MESITQLTGKVLGLPVLAADSGKGVDDLIIYIHWLMIALFVGWLCFFAFTLVRFRRARNPKADYLGVRSHASNYIELAVAGVEGLLLFGVAVPLWARATNERPPETESTVIQVVAQQFAWNIRYQGKDAVFGRQDMRFVSSSNAFGVDPDDPKGKDDVEVQDQFHVPLNKPVIAYISSKDVIHSFKVIALRVTQDAIPGMRIPIWFKPTKVGSYQINCAQLCGNGHYSMSRGMLYVDTEADFDTWLASKKAGGAVSLE